MLADSVVATDAEGRAATTLTVTAFDVQTIPDGGTFEVQATFLRRPTVRESIGIRVNP